MIEHVDWQTDNQIRFRDEEHDSAWFDVMDGGTVVVTAIDHNDRHVAVFLSNSERVALIRHLSRPDWSASRTRKLRVTWRHPAVLGGSVRVNDVETDDSEPLERVIARAFCPYGVEGESGVTIRNVKEI